MKSMKKTKRIEKPKHPKPRREKRVILSSWYEPKTLYITTVDEIERKSYEN